MQILPPDFWRKHSETRRDVLAALERMEHVGNLPCPLWQAWVWHETGVPTALLAWDDTSKERGGQKWRLVAPLVRQADGTFTTRADYHFISDICNPEKGWARRIGVPMLAQMLSFLDDEQERQHGWNALNRVKAGDAPNVPQLRQRISTLSQNLAMETPRLLLVDTEKREEVAGELAAVGDHMTKFFGEETP